MAAAWKPKNASRYSLGCYGEIIMAAFELTRKNFKVHRLSD